MLIQFASVRDAFGIDKPSIADLEIIFGFGIFVFIAMEVLKAIVRRKMAVPRQSRYVVPETIRLNLLRFNIRGMGN